MGKVKSFRPFRRIATIGNHTPRQCGIATFTADLVGAISRRYPELDCVTVAMNDREEGYDYPPVVRHEIQAGAREDYLRIADTLNADGTDVVCLQHEYGIFGGPSGSHILELLRELEMPVVTTLHTILQNPNASQCAVMSELTRLSDRLIVMSERGSQFLQDVHGVDPQKIDVIHHGIPDVPTESQEFFKDRFGLMGKSVLLTFGLLSPDKGVENVLEALPAILKSFPEVVYVVLGATHPHILKNHGEGYRQSLETMVERLGIGANVRFLNRFATQAELTEYLRAADLYITPYLKPEQITSGTLAYAVGSGNAVISTPYYYAEELLAEGRGVLVPWRDPVAIAREVADLLGNPEKLERIQARAAELGREMTWPSVAEKYLASFERARSDRGDSAAKFLSSKVPLAASLKVPAINLAHLLRMTDDTGLFQHATHSIPNRHEGYCIDDNVRALLLMAHLERSSGVLQETVRALELRYLSFVHHALDFESGRFRNFLSYDRRWLEDCGSEDSHGRTLWGLGTVMRWTGDGAARSLATQLFRASISTVSAFASPRAWAYALLGLDDALRFDPENRDSIQLRNELSDRLYAQFVANDATDWPWLEDSVTYANARLPQALILSGGARKRADMLEVGLHSLGWLCKIQRDKSEAFSPIGSNGFYVRGRTPARFDQQPIEACGMISACRAAFEATGDERWKREALRAFSWFLGGNALQVPLCDPITGGCCDGLHSDRRNENQGAESTLSFLQSQVEIRFAID